MDRRSHPEMIREKVGIRCHGVIRNEAERGSRRGRHPHTVIFWYVNVNAIVPRPVLPSALAVVLVEGPTLAN